MKGVENGELEVGGCGRCVSICVIGCAEVVHARKNDVMALYRLPSICLSDIRTAVLTPKSTANSTKSTNKRANSKIYDVKTKQFF